MVDYPAIIDNGQYSHRDPNQKQLKNGMGELCNDLLESPYIQKFTEQDENHANNQPLQRDHNDS